MFNKKLKEKIKNLEKELAELKQNYYALQKAYTWKCNSYMELLNILKNKR